MESGKTLKAEQALMAETFMPSVAAGSALGSIVPGIGTIVGAGVGLVVGVFIDVGMNKKVFGSDKTIKENIKDGVGTITKEIGGALKDIF